MSRCISLRKLSCNDTEISELSIECLVLLEDLYIYGTAIMHIDLTMLPRLKQVRGCDDNGRVVLIAERVMRW